ncbi:MAG: aminotransferase class III-fold pyridoxal phosphate-dependent enzyme, partial [Gammaproteobacteria bacterium]
MDTQPSSARDAEAASLLNVYAQLDLEPVSAAGPYIQCADRKLLDFYGGHAVAGLGYAHPAIVDALKTQAHELFFQSNAIALDVRAEAGRKLVDFAPATLHKAFFVNSGAEANENALRLAMKHTGRSQVVAIE